MDKKIVIVLFSDRIVSSKTMDQLFDLLGIVQGKSFFEELQHLQAGVPRESIFRFIFINRFSQIVNLKAHLFVYFLAHERQSSDIGPSTLATSVLFFFKPRLDPFKLFSIMGSFFLGYVLEMLLGQIEPKRPQ